MGPDCEGREEAEEGRVCPPYQGIKFLINSYPSEASLSVVFSYDPNFFDRMNAQPILVFLHNPFSYE